ncbi:MAG: phosphate ABC transporter permease subunit PstC [Phycisphaerales bacterium]|nr:phosphate ABC transporter permease subunit PstC [Phycisphaerales bacterium]
MTTATAHAPAVVSAGTPRNAVARTLRERVIIGGLLACGLFSLATTASIIAVLATETYRFFTFTQIKPEYGALDADHLRALEASGVVTTEHVTTVWEFLTGLQWNPLLGAEKHFGILPLINGTLLVAFIAMCVALPLGLITAIWLSEYAPERIRRILKPVLEMIAGVPTVVFGFFAFSFITGAIRFEWLSALDNPLKFGTYNALSAGIAVGILCLPIVTSLAEDALRAVPKSLREGSYGLGATRFETSVKVVLPAALSGIIAAFLLAVARAVGETMIVALAAGASPIALHDLADTPLDEPDVRMIVGADSELATLTIGPGETVESPVIDLPAGWGLGRVALEYTAPSDHLLETTLVLVDDAQLRDTTAAIGVDGTVVAERWTCCDAGNIALSPEHQDAGAYVVRFTAHETSEPIEVTSLSAVVGEHESIMHFLALPVDVRREIQPMTGYMVQIFLGDASNFGPEYFSSYAVATTLFLMTFILTVIGHRVRVRFRQVYE